MKHTLLNHSLMEEGVPLHIVSSMAAGLMCAITTSPVDTIKTRVMNQHKIGQCLFIVALRTHGSENSLQARHYAVECGYLQQSAVKCMY